VLKEGVVAEEGTHAELLKRGGLYAELHRIQVESPAPPVESSPQPTPLATPQS
jgi:hypothetical protein